MKTMKTQKVKYFIGDVHGCYLTLIALLDKLPNRGIGLDITFLGDIIDRGPDSTKIVDLILERGYTCIRGNHEDMMVECWNNMGCDGWERNGGDELKEEFEALNETDPERYATYRKFFFGLERFIVLDEEWNIEDRRILLTHAPAGEFFPEEIPEKSSDLGPKYEDLMIWNRRLPMYIDKIYFNIVGHNPSFTIKDRYGPDVLDEDDLLIRSDFASIDTSCVYGKRYNGKLTCLVLPIDAKDINDIDIIQQVNVELPVIFEREKVKQTQGYMG